MDKLVEEKTKEVNYNEGKIEGIEETTINVIKSMLDNHLDYELISKVSGKTIEEIKKNRE